MFHADPLRYVSKGSGALRYNRPCRPICYVNIGRSVSVLHDVVTYDGYTVYTKRRAAAMAHRTKICLWLWFRLPWHSLAPSNHGCSFQRKITRVVVLGTRTHTRTMSTRIQVRVQVLRHWFSFFCVFTHISKYDRIVQINATRVYVILLSALSATDRNRSTLPAEVVRCSSLTIDRSISINNLWYNGIFK